MKKFNFAQKAFIVHENKILLVKKSEQDPSHPNEWEVPGGRIEFGENLEDHIKREVKEEVGLDIILGVPFSMWTWIMHRGEDDIQVIAVGRICQPVNTITDSTNRVEDDFLSDIAWVDIDQVFEYKLIPDLVPTMQKFIDIYKNQNALL